MDVSKTNIVSLMNIDKKQWFISLLSLIIQNPQINTPVQQSLSWWRKISVEPVMFLYMGSFMLNTVLEQAFFVYKACTVDLKLPADICANISAKENQENYKRVQVSFWD